MKQQTGNLIEVNGQLLPKSATQQLKRFALKLVDTGFTMVKTLISTSHEGQQVCRNIHNREGNDFQEFFYVVFLNRANYPVGYYVASMGGVTGTVADPRLIIKAAALANCVSVILCHNHPSGSIKPSQADQALTLKIKEAFQWFDIKVLDHVILGEGDYYSFADEGLI